MKILVVGSGSREHALAWRFAQDESVEQVYLAPGNGGSEYGKIKNVAANSINQWLEVAQEFKIDLTVVGPEVPLVMGIVDKFHEHDLTILGPTASVARLEGSKKFGKKIMQRYGIPYADYEVIYDLNQGKVLLADWEPPYVLKADGLTGGKGVIVTSDKHYAIETMQSFLEGFYSASSTKIILEKYIEGEEISISVLCDGNNAMFLGTAQDYKSLRDNNEGPNTGGMGAYSPSDDEHNKNINVERLMSVFVEPVLTAFQDRGQPYRGFLYPGLIRDKDGHYYCLEYNCRFGDPEAQVQLPRFEGDFAKVCLAAANGKFTDEKITLSDARSVGVVLASKGYPFLGHSSGIAYIPYSVKDNYVFHGTTRRDETGAIIAEGGRVATFVGVGDSMEKARDLAYKSINSSVLVDGQYRKDIALT